jgi:hypothetical protein
MMQELLNATIAPVISANVNTNKASVDTNKVIGELTGAIKTLVGAAGAPGGGDDSSDDETKRPKSTPGKDKG